MFRKKNTELFNQDYKAFCKQHASKTEGQNYTLAKNLLLSTNSREAKRNGHIFMLAGWTEAKKWLYANIVPCHSNYIIPDYDGEIYDDTHKFLESSGYNVHVLDMRASTKEYWDPVASLQKYGNTYTEAIDTMSHILCRDVSTDPFLRKACEHILSMMLGYVKTLPAEQQTLRQVMDCVHKMQFDGNERKHWKFVTQCDDPLVIQRYQFLENLPLQALKEATVEISMAIHRYVPFDGQQRFDFQTLGSGKHALFIRHMAQPDDMCKMSLLYTQLLENLYAFAESTPEHKCERPVMVMLNQWIYNAPTKIITANKYNIHFFMPWHSMAELRHTYQEDWDCVQGNCDTFIYMGHPGAGDREYVSKMLEQREHQKGGMQLSTALALQNMQPEECIVFVRGEAPFLAEKDYSNAHQLLWNNSFAKR
ncbi:MAG: type IV secretory system conjugative DNA transfer family protein [Bacteroidaceae bacterium]|nr:type IV secretory system conjugative DNA transfer family protein [Bacteroidaceae bacterium]